MAVIEPVEARLIGELLTASRAWCAAYGLSFSTLGRRAVGDSELLFKLQRGEGSITLRQYDRVVAFINSSMADLKRSKPNARTAERTPSVRDCLPCDGRTDV